MRFRHVLLGLALGAVIGCQPSPEPTPSKGVQTGEDKTTKPGTSEADKAKALEDQRKADAKIKIDTSKPPYPAVTVKRSKLFKWAPNREEGLARAKKTGGYVVLIFEADYIGQCIIMNREGLQDPGAAKLLAKAILVSIDVETKAGLKLSDDYKAEEVPTFVFLKPDGTEFGRFFGFMNPDWFRREIGRLFDRAKRAQ